MLAIRNAWVLEDRDDLETVMLQRFLFGSELVTPRYAAVEGVPIVKMESPKPHIPNGRI